MKYGIIDTGSNTIRLNLYDTEHGALPLAGKKITAGLASYISGGELSRDGIDAACGALAEIKRVLGSFGVDEAAAFATAALRNISNSEAAIREIQERTGIELTLLSGEAEALMGWLGARAEFISDSGALIDIGGGSTEITVFGPEGPQTAVSFPVGSLSIRAVCGITAPLPLKRDMGAIKAALRETFGGGALERFGRCRDICAVGGTARAALTLARRAFALAPDTRTLSASDVRRLRDALASGVPEMIDLVLKHAPDRVHTILPGIAILFAVTKRLGGERVTICSGGVREGYLRSRYLGEALPAKPRP